MIRIVGIQKGPTPDTEFILLQNQGAMRAHLRGHALVSARWFSGAGPFPVVLSDDVYIASSQYVWVSSGRGTNGWGMTKDGAHIYKVFLGSSQVLWGEAPEQIHLLNIQHTYSERSQEAVLV